MFSHVHIGVPSLAAGMAFYGPLMKELGWRSRFVDEARAWTGWQSGTSPRPLLLVGVPENGKSHLPGNGQMIAFDCRSAETVDQAYSIALRLGGHCGGPPGPRPQYHAAYYGAYVFDPFENKIAFACHEWMQ